MAFVEQLICGVNPGSLHSERSLLGHSPGMGSAVADELVALCSEWGTSPPGGLMRPSVLSFPLNSTMPSIRGQLFAVIRVTTAVPAMFHAVVMSRADFRTFAYNPYAVIVTGIFQDSWKGESRLTRSIIEPPDQSSIFTPPANPGDVGLVDDALLHFLVKGKLVLNLEAASPESDRALGLVIQVMPMAFREKLRFASFAPSGGNQYTLAAAYTRDTPFVSWQRLFMTMLDQGTPESVRQYVASVRNGLAVGDLELINRADTLRGIRSESGAVRPTPSAEPLSSGNVPFIQEMTRNHGSSVSNRPGAGGQRIATVVVPGSNGHQPVDNRKFGQRSAGNQPGSNHFTTTTPGMVRSPVNSSSWNSNGPARSRLVRQSVSLNKGDQGRQPHALLTSILVLVFLAVGWVFIQSSGLGEQWGVTGLFDGRSARSGDSKAASLLEVVDVGKEYSNQIQKMKKINLMPGNDRDKVLHKAMAEMQADVAGPLLVQADLFLKLADDGIQQGLRPDREKDRLQSLERQGKVLIAELGRLELVFYSLQNGILWQDLGGLPDAAVNARRDSLLRVAPGPLMAVSGEVGSAPYWGALASAGNNVSGMAALLSLFQVPAWSETWEAEMKNAAEKVSPTASPMSRAYRNNAFTLVRLKRAERHDDNLSLAYNREFGKGVWPSPAVKDILPELRNKTGLFAAGEMPGLLTDVIVLYSMLSDPVSLAREAAGSAEVLANLEQNQALIFDPLVYENYLARISFEAIGQLMDKGVAPDQLPGHLLRGLDPQAAVLFHEALKKNENTVDWNEVVDLTGDSFLGRWAGRQAAEAQARAGLMREKLDQAWEESLVLAGQLKTRADQGADWTSVWVDLQGELDKVLAFSPTTMQADSIRAAKWNLAADLKAEFAAPRPLNLNSVVVRLDQQVMDSPGNVVVVFNLEREGQMFESGPLRMGPAAPEGTGWVGTTDLNWVAHVSPEDSFSIQVLLPGRTAPLLNVDYPSLNDRVGPAALVRPRRAEGGALVFQTGDRWWRDIPLPEIP